MSDVGCVRDENQDFMGYFRRGEDQLLLVADGMGGHSGGFEASRVAVDFIGTAFAEADGSQSPGEILASSILAANAAVRQVAANNPLLEGMGTTVVAAIVQNGIATFAHVGDSRAYLIRDGQAILITLDHSRIFRMLEAGMVHAGQIDDHPMGHILERSIGSSEIVDVEVGAQGIQLRQGDRLVLCSDGLWGLVNDPEIAQVFSGQDLKAAVEESIGMALARGADDNTTVGALEVVEGPTQTPEVVDCRAALLAANPVPPPEPETEPLAPIAQEPAPLRGPSPADIRSEKLKRYGAIAVGLILLVVAFLAYSKMGDSGEEPVANDPGQNTDNQAQEQEKTAAEKAELAKKRETDAIARAQETAERAETARTEADEAEKKAEAADEESKEAADAAAKEAADKADEAEAQVDETVEQAETAKAEAKDADDLAEKEAAEAVKAAKEAAKAEKEADAEKAAQAAEEANKTAEDAAKAAEEANKAAEDAAKAVETESN
jgi:protein phosphatase